MKILVVRFSSIGDIVLTTPVVRCLKKQLGAEVHFLTKAAYAEMLAPNPYIDRVWTIRQKVNEVVPALRRLGLDHIIDLHHNLRSWQLRLRLGVQTHAYDKLNWQKWLLVRFKVDRMPDRHVVDRYMDAASSLGVENDGAGLDYFIPEAEEVQPSEWFEGRPAAFGALAMGAAHATKRLPPERLRELCRGIDMPVVLLGGPADREVGDWVAGAGHHVSNQCGRLRLNQSASVIRQSSWVISHDTGMMHIAAALRKPIVSVWGNTVPAFGMYPYLPAGSPAESRIEVAGLACRPCSKIGFARCPRGHFRCMRDIAIPEILAHLPADQPG